MLGESMYHSQQPLLALYRLPQLLNNGVVILKPLAHACELGLFGGGAVGVGALGGGDVEESEGVVDHVLAESVGHVVGV